MPIEDAAAEKAWELLGQATISVADWQRRVDSGWYAQRLINPDADTKIGQAKGLLFGKLLPSEMVLPSDSLLPR